MARFFHIQKAKRFSYKPRYYNEAAEIRKVREEKIKKEVEAEREGRPTRLSKDDMTNYIKMARRTQKKSNIRLLVILVLLLLIFYIFFFK
ncbi:MAG: hypothetical protein JEZ09_16425 [Salinivirgaceae bacterium]|nr:hypothetical protein [Salinivirgaceae bacterium]